MTPIIQLKDINKRVQDGTKFLQILKDCSITIQQGEMVAILGRSGAGKTTLLNLMAMLDNDYQGDYYFDQMNAHAKTDAERFSLRTKFIGYIFQDFQLIEEFTVLQNVEMPLGYQGVPRKVRIQRSLKAIEDVGLGRRGDSNVGTLSGGERQRVCIARALAHQPKIILADEPTGSLDPKTSEEVMTLLIDLNRAFNITEVIVTHDEVVANRCSRIYTLKNGGIHYER